MKKTTLAASFIVTVATAQLAACGGSQTAGNPPMPEEEVHANPPGHEEVGDHDNPPGPEMETPEGTENPPGPEVEEPAGPTENPPGPEH